jgi:hypothetical protein
VRIPPQEGFREIAAFDQQLSFQEATSGRPKIRVQICRHIDQTRDFSIGGREVANHGRDTADAEIQGATKEEQVIRAMRLFRACVSFNERPFREALYPQRSS